MQNQTPNNQTKRTSFVITKRIAKHGNQAIIVIPRILEQHLKPGTLTQLTIDVLSNNSEEEVKIVVEEK